MVDVLDSYVHEVFQPWWDEKKVPASKDRWILDLDRSPIPLREVLEHWTVDDPDNAAFTPPDGARRDATQTMRTAFRKAVTDLAGKLGDRPAAWDWGKLHTREILDHRAPGLGYERYSAGGDPWTVNAAGGELNSSYGPSIRLVVRWTGRGTADAVAIYPGGQSDTRPPPGTTTSSSSGGTRSTCPCGSPDSTATWTLRAGE